MNNVIEFPGKDVRQWAGIAEEMKIYLSGLGADEEEIKQVLIRLQGHWNNLGAPVVLSAPYTLPADMTPEQVAATEAAVRVRVAELTELHKLEHGKTLMEFARLEYQLQRKC